jgi:hypothetical protein
MMSLPGSPPRAALVAAVVMVIGVHGAARAQSLRVHATEEQTGRPLAGALVDVLDATNGVVSQGVLSPEATRRSSVPPSP